MVSHSFSYVFHRFLIPTCPHACAGGGASSCVFHRFFMIFSWFWRFWRFYQLRLPTRWVFFFLLITSWFFLTSAKNNRENYQKTSKTLIFNFFHFSPLGEKWKKQLFMKNRFSWQNHANMTGHRSWKIYEKTTVELALTLDY